LDRNYHDSQLLQKIAIMTTIFMIYYHFNLKVVSSSLLQSFHSHTSRMALHHAAILSCHFIMLIGRQSVMHEPWPYSLFFGMILLYVSFPSLSLLLLCNIWMMSWSIGGLCPFLLILLWVLCFLLTVIVLHPHCHCILSSLLSYFVLTVIVFCPTVIVFCPHCHYVCPHCHCVCPHCHCVSSSLLLLFFMCNVIFLPLCFPSSSSLL